MRIATAVACAALLAAGQMRDAAAAIVRCEAADGKIVYSNTECPPETKLVRKVDQSPPVIVHDGARPAAKAGVRVPPAVEPARARPAPDPNQEDRELTEQLAAQRRECEVRLRDIERLQQDLDAAPSGARASAELALRRAQDDYRALCPRQR